MLQVLLVVIVVLQSCDLHSEDGWGVIHDNLDRCIETALKRAHKTPVLAIKACDRVSVISRASIIWVQKLMQSHQLETSGSANRIIFTARYFSKDVALDASLSLHG